MAEYSVHKPYTVVVAVVIVILLGIISFFNMSTDLLPSIDLPYVIVMTAYPGASPEEVELQVSRPLEQALATTSNVQNISSTSAENMSTIVMEFAQDTNMDSVLIEMTGTIDMVESSWSEGIGSPTLMKLNPDAMPIMVAAVAVDGMDREGVSEFAQDEIVPALERLEGVASITLLGAVETEYDFVVDPDKVASLSTRLQDSIDGKLEEARQELEDARGELEDGKATLADESVEQTARLTLAQMQLTDGKIQMAQAETQLTVAAMQIQQAIAMGEQTITQLNGQLIPLLDQQEALDAQIADLEDAASQIRDAIRQIDEGTAQLREARKQLQEAVSAMEAAGQPVPDELMAQLADLDQQIADLDEQREALSEQLASVQEGLDAAAAGRSELEAGIATLQENISAAQASVSQGRAQLAQIEQSQAAIASGRSELSAGEQQIAQGTGSLTSGLNEATGELAAAQAALAVGDQQMETQSESVQGQGDLSAVITPAMVAQIISAQNFAMPAGYVTAGGEEYLVRVGDKITTLEELENLPLFHLGDDLGNVYASDVGTFELRDNSEDLYAKINGMNGLVLIAQKQSTYSTAAVSDDLGEAVAELSDTYPGLSVTMLMDQGAYIDLVVENVLQNLLYGAVLAILVLFAFLRSLRPTVIIAVSIPISVVFALVLMYFSGINLNLISMSGLALGVGMLVDNSIVVIENTFRLRSEGASPKKAAVKGATQVAGAITASTITTICVFLPIVFTNGISKQIFTDMGLTIAYSLLASLIAALTVVPAMSVPMLRKMKETNRQGRFGRFQEKYGQALGWCIRHKVIILIPVFALFIGCVVNVFQIGLSFMPEMDATELTATLAVPDEATPQETEETVDEAADRIRNVPGVDVVGVMDMSAASGYMGGLIGASSGSFTMYITLDENRTETSTQIADRVRESVADLDTEISVSASTIDISAYTGSGISVRIEGTDIDAMREAAEDVAAMLEKTEGTMDISDGLEDATPEIRIAVRKDKAMEQGLNTAQVYQAVAAAISDGSDAGTVTLDGTDYPVLVLEEGASEKTREEIGNIEIHGESAGEETTAQLKEIADITEGLSLASIYRENQVRYWNVTAGIDSAHNVSLVTRDFEARMALYTPPGGVTVTVEGETSTIMDALGDLLFMLGVAIALVYLIMVAQFQSLKSPFIVMFTIPLAFTGGLLALFIGGFELSIIAMLGFLILSGIIVNNGIVLVDYTNQLRNEGMERTEAIKLAGRTRMRPVLMTALTTILGLLTLAMGAGQGADMLQPMAVVTIGGLAYGTLLTLFVVPCLYDLFNGGSKERSRRRLKESKDELPSEAEEEKS